MNGIHQRLGLVAALLVAAVALSACPGPQPIPDEKPQPDLVTRATPELPVVPQEVIDRSGVVEFDVDGLKVILKRTPGNPVVSGQLFIDGGASESTAETAGLDEMALSVAVGGGTATTPRDAFNSRLESMGSAIGASANRDYSVISMRSVRPYFEPTWALFAQVLTEAAFDQKEYDLTRQRTVEAIKSQDDDPEQSMSNTASDLFFQGHPYVIRTIGTVESVESFTREQLQAHYKGLLTRERLTLVVVGDVEQGLITEALGRDLAALPRGDWKRKDLEKLAPGPSDLATVTRELPTNYMLGYYAAPSPTDPDYYPMLVATNLLSDRLFEEVRTKRNLTYAVSSGLASRPYNYGYLYITTVKPNEAIPVMYAEIDRIQNELVDAKALSDQVELFLTEHFMKQETNSAQAATLGAYELTGGGWQQSLVFLDRIKAVTPEQIQATARNYFKNIHWGVVGNPEALDPEVLTAR